MDAISPEMYALEIDSYQEDILEAIRKLKVIKKLTPRPSHGQVLVKVEAAPCNPSDLLLLQGHYGKRKTLPATPGWEGAGTVVATGGGILGWWLMGKRVAFSAQTDAGGSWAEYCVVDAKTCITLHSEVNFEQGACLIINPLTALGMIDQAEREGHTAIIQTAAVSQVGRMVAALAQIKKIPTIHIVRRKEQEALLKGQIVLNSESPSFSQDLKKQAEALNATIAFDAVGGSMTGTLLSAMPDRSKALVYGALSGSACSNISPLSLIFQQKSVEGFFLSSWLASKSFWGTYKAANQVQRLIASGSFHTEIAAKVSLKDAPKALESYQKEMTAGKVLICPSHRS